MDKNIYYKVLDHGFISAIDWMGNDHDIAEAARCSVGGGFSCKNKDDRELIRYLMRHSHFSPMEMAEVKFHVAMPIFVARQQVRHRTCNFSEHSSRYSEMPQVYFLPDKWREQSKVRIQGSSNEEINPISQELLKRDSEDLQHRANQLYKLKLQSGLSRELARTDIPISIYTMMYIKCDLRNWLHFLELRLDSHAQYEIREYAKMIASYIQHLFPITWEAFSDYILFGQKFSRQELCLIKSMDGDWQDCIANKKDSMPPHYDILQKRSKELGMTKLEFEEFWEKYASTNNNVAKITSIGLLPILSKDEILKKYYPQNDKPKDNQ